MTRCQSRWVNLVIIALVVILRSPTLLPSLYTTDEAYYGTIANDILDGGAVYRTAVDTKPPGMYYIYAGVFRVAGRNNLFAVHVLAIFVVVATALVLRRIGARLADDWAGAWSGIGYVIFVHAYWPGDTLGANSEIFASLPLALSVLAFLQAQKKPAWSLMFLSGALVGVATLIRQPSAVNLGVLLACLVYGWLIARSHSFARVLAAGSGVVIGFIAVIAALAWYYQLQGNLHDAYLWAWAFAIRYVESETTFGYVLKRLVTVHLAVILLSGLLWYFGIWQVVETLRSFWRRKRCLLRGDPAYFVVRPHLSCDLYWMAISGTLSSGSASAAVDSRGPGVLALCRKTATFSSATLAMDPNRHHRCGRAPSDGFSHRGLYSQSADARFSPDCSADRQGDETERSYLCLGKFPTALQFLRPADGDAFRKLFTPGWRLRHPAS